MSIPNWAADGVLPPIDLVNPISKIRSPYRSSLSDFVMRFGISAERREILNGWLQYRARMHELGMTSGFQWVDGSFLENIETIESRSPADIDCVTFFHLPNGRTELDLYDADNDLFLKPAVKARFKVDAYMVNLATAPKSLIDQGCYWYSVWSHRRDLKWKGFVQIDLDPADDEIGRGYLDFMNQESSS